MAPGQRVLCRKEASMTKHLDILGIGCVAVDDLLFVERYPPADAKARVWRTERQCGGLTATALVAAARLGARCAYAGVLGTDELCQFAAARLQAEDVSMKHAVRDPRAHAVHSTIVVSSSQQSRNIFYDHTGVVCAHSNRPTANVIRSAKVLFVDYVALPEVVRAARIAVAAGIPIVADLEAVDRPGFAA
jgi:sulfofructose kinase